MSFKKNHIARDSILICKSISKSLLVSLTEFPKVGIIKFKGMNIHSSSYHICQMCYCQITFKKGVTIYTPIDFSSF